MIAFCEKQKESCIYQYLLFQQDLSHIDQGFSIFLMPWTPEYESPLVTDPIKGIYMENVLIFFYF